MSNRIEECCNTSAHFEQEKLYDILEYVARRAKREGWDMAKLQDKLAGYYLTDEEPQPLPPPPPHLRGTPDKPCEECEQTTHGATLQDGWYRCDRCGYPSK
jgi:hypothetical protein